MGQERPSALARNWDSGKQVPNVLALPIRNVKMLNRGPQSIKGGFASGPLVNVHRACKMSLLLRLLFMSNLPGAHLAVAAGLCTWS